MAGKVGKKVRALKKPASKDLDAQRPSEVAKAAGAPELDLGDFDGVEAAAEQTAAIVVVQSETGPSALSLSAQLAAAKKDAAQAREHAEGCQALMNEACGKANSVMQELEAIKATALCGAKGPNGQRCTMPYGHGDAGHGNPAWRDLEDLKAFWAPWGAIPRLAKEAGVSPEELEEILREVIAENAAEAAEAAKPASGRQKKADPKPAPVEPLPKMEAKDAAKAILQYLGACNLKTADQDAVADGIRQTVDWTVQVLKALSKKGFVTKTGTLWTLATK